MDTNAILVICVGVLGAGTLFGFFKTKKPGYGPYNTSTLLLLLVVVVSALTAVSCKLEPQTIANIFFAVIGFAGGLFGRKMAGSGAKNKPESGKP
jgi:hypothetical protein